MKHVFFNGKTSIPDNYNYTILEPAAYCVLKNSHVIPFVISK